MTEAPTTVGKRDLVQISRSELTRLRNEENYTIAQLSEYFQASTDVIKQAMEKCGLSTSLKNRKRRTYTLVD